MLWGLEGKLGVVGVEGRPVGTLEGEEVCWGTSRGNMGLEGENRTKGWEAMLFVHVDSKDGERGARSKIRGSSTPVRMTSKGGRRLPAGKGRSRGQVH